MGNNRSNTAKNTSDRNEIFKKSGKCDNHVQDKTKTRNNECGN